MAARLQKALAHQVVRREGWREGEFGTELRWVICSHGPGLRLPAKLVFQKSRRGLADSSSRATATTLLKIDVLEGDVRKIIRVSLSLAGRTCARK